MAESAVSVVRCSACRHSEHLLLHSGRFWCALCQRWAEVELERVLGATVVLDGDHFRLSPERRIDYGLQPLRIPHGWQILWNALGEEEPSEFLESVAYAGGRNLFLATNEHVGQTLDVEWRTDGDPNTGRYVLRVMPQIDGEGVAPDGSPQQQVGWDVPLHTFETTLRATLVAELERWLSGITS
jgi:hypothetical protein